MIKRTNELLEEGMYIYDCVDPKSIRIIQILSIQNKPQQIVYSQVYKKTLEESVTSLRTGPNAFWQPEDHIAQEFEIPKTVLKKLKAAKLQFILNK